MEFMRGIILRKGKGNFYIKLLSFATILATLPVIILGIFSYLKSSEIIQDNIAEEKQQSVYQIQTNFEQVLKMVDLSVSNFVTSYQLLSTLEEPLTANQFQLYNQIKKELSQLQQFDAGLSDFLLVSLEKGWRINNNGLRRLQIQETNDVIDKYYSSPSKSTWIIQNEEDILFDSNPGSSCKSYLSLVKQLPLNSYTKAGVGVAYIPICNFSEILTGNLDSEEITVLNEMNQVVGHSVFDHIGNDFSNESLVEILNTYEEPNGQFNITKDDGEYNVRNRTSSYNNWRYISVIKVSELNKEIRSIAWITFLICSIMIVGIFIFAYIVSRRLYAPINRLAKTVSDSFTVSPSVSKDKDEFGLIEKQIKHMLDQNDQLELKLQGQVGQLKQFFMARLLQGKMNAQELKSKIVSFNYNDSWKRLSILTIQVDSLEDSRYQPEDEDLLLFTINTMIEELIPAINRMTPIVVNRTQVTIYLDHHDTDSEYNETISEMIKMIQSKVKDELNLSISIGLSEPHTELIEANKAFKESLEALRYTLKFGPGSIIFFENLQRESSFYTFYPRQVENELFDAIKIGDKESVAENLNKLMEALFDEKLSHTQYEIAIVRFLTNIIELTETLGVDVLEFEKHQSLFDQLYDFRTLPEVENWFRNTIIYPLLNKVEERTESQYKNISDEIIHIVQQEFDSDLTLNYIADKLHYNPNYLSSIFRKETNTSFSDYLALFRINKAKEWLVETDMTVKEIAEKLNYNNSQNFIRSFRKVEGTTPGRYRSSKRSE